MADNYISFEELKIRLKPAERRAAEAIVNNDFAEKGERKTLGEIADDLTIDRRTLYNWRSNPDFTAYMAAISDNKLDQFRSLADSQLMKLVTGTSNNGLPSIRGLEMYYKLVGRMKESTVVQINDGKQPTMTRAQASEELEKFTIVQ